MGVPRIAALLLLLVLTTANSLAYSVLTHEEVIDIVWKDELRPMLLQRFPRLTEDQLREAHAYTYGGAVIQDLGYYPFGSKQFSNLVHYVRSGDFVTELIRESKDYKEYAFALGALSHYAADTEGHPAVNRSVAIEYPKLRAKFGDSVTYAQDKSAHLKTEFSFDVVQVAKARYASRQYHDFIGFEVSQSLLERVSPRVYGLEFKDLIANEELAIGTYRYSVSSVIPSMTKVATHLRGKGIVPEKDNAERRKFLYRISRADYEREWGKKYRKPGIGTRLILFIVRLLPKVGPLRALAFRDPTQQTQDLYFSSINDTIDRYREYLRQVRAGNLKLADLDFDTGAPTRPCEYALGDETYAELLRDLRKKDFQLTSPELRKDLLTFFSDPDAPYSARKDKHKWQDTLKALDALKAWQPTPVAAHGED